MDHRLASGLLRPAELLSGRRGRAGQAWYSAASRRVIIRSPGVCSMMAGAPRGAIST